MLFRGGNAIPCNTGKNLDRCTIPVRPALQSWNAHILFIDGESLMLAGLLLRGRSTGYDEAGFLA